MDEEKVKCPRCNSEQITANKKGFSIGKAAVGAVVTGGIGLLAGGIGAQKIKLSCLKCGHSWLPNYKPPKAPPPVKAESTSSPWNVVIFIIIVAIVIYLLS